jgi:hypothetical protein
MPAARLAETAADGRCVTVRATHGSCDDGPVVKALETDGSVVLYASVAGGAERPLPRRHDRTEREGGTGEAAR